MRSLVRRAGTHWALVVLLTVGASWAALPGCGGGSNTDRETVFVSSCLLASGNDPQPLNQLLEFRLDGRLLASDTIPPPTGQAPDFARGVAVDSGGSAYIWYGTLPAHLVVRRSAASGFEYVAGPIISTVNSISYGPVAANRNYVYVSDMGSGTDTDSGIIRFSKADWSWQRFASGDTYVDLKMGLDGLLYGLGPDGSQPPQGFRVFDPATMEVKRTVQFGGDWIIAGITGIAADASGTIYACGLGKIYRISPQGAILKELNPNVSDMTDIDIAPSGRVVVGSRYGDIVVTDMSLDSYRVFSSGEGFAHVSFAHD